MYFTNLKNYIEADLSNYNSFDERNLTNQKRDLFMKLSFIWADNGNFCLEFILIMLPVMNPTFSLIKFERNLLSAFISFFIKASLFDHIIEL